MTDYFTQANIVAHGPGCSAGLLPTTLLSPEDTWLLDRFGISTEQIDDFTYLVADYSLELIIDTDAGEVQLDDVLQALIQRSDGQITHITIAAAHTASKSRPNAYGGFAEVITADSVEFISLYEWIQRHLQTPAERAAQARRYLEQQGYTVIAPDQPVYVVLGIEALAVQKVLLFTDADAANQAYNRLRAAIFQVDVQDLTDYAWELYLENLRAGGGNLAEKHSALFIRPLPANDEENTQ